MRLADYDDDLRAAMFIHLGELARRHHDGMTSSTINTFAFHGRPIPLTVQPGIWKPAGLDAALTIRTTWNSPYNDQVTDEGDLRYQWRGTDAQHADNRALRRAWQEERPLAYFHAVARGVYQALFPVYVLDEDASRFEFLIDLQRVDLPDTIRSADVAGLGATRSYRERVARQRLHQLTFRTRVMRAYQSQCAMCRLRHPSLLDAAHILPDLHPNGDPVINNGLALCKIHHAAYDVNIVGVRPDLVVEIREDIRLEHDGPMLRHGLQELHRARLTVPRAESERPDPERLSERYEAFRAA